MRSVSATMKPNLTEHVAVIYHFPSFYATKKKERKKEKKEKRNKKENEQKKKKRKEKPQ